MLANPIAEPEEAAQPTQDGKKGGPLSFLPCFKSKKIEPEPEDADRQPRRVDYNGARALGASALRSDCTLPCSDCAVQ